MSRLALALLVALWPTAPLSAQIAARAGRTAEEAMANYRQTFKSTQEHACPRGEDPDEIVVCARSKEEEEADPGRLPLPVEPEPGARVVGGLPNGTASMNADSCLRLCPQPVQIDVIKAAKFMRNLADRIINGD